MAWKIFMCIMPYIEVGKISIWNTQWRAYLYVRFLCHSISIVWSYLQVSLVALTDRDSERAFNVQYKVNVLCISGCNEDFSSFERFQLSVLLNFFSGCVEPHPQFHTYLVNWGPVTISGGYDPYWVSFLFGKKYPIKYRSVSLST